MNLHLVAFFLIAAFLSGGCVARSAPDRALSLDQALAPMKAVATVEAPAGALEVTLIGDLHSTRPGFHRVRPDIAEVQRDNRRLVDALVSEGWTLLGCEYRRGALVESKETKTQYSIVRRRLETDGRHSAFLDGWSVFQPIRYQLQHEGKLRVHGVEDPDLYSADLEYFSNFKRFESLSRRKDLSDADRSAAREGAALARKALLQNTAARGRAAARELVTLMKSMKVRRAIFLQGRAHRKAAMSEFQRLGVLVRAYESQPKSESSTNSAKP